MITHSPQQFGVEDWNEASEKRSLVATTEIGRLASVDSQKPPMRLLFLTEDLQ